MEKQYRKRSVSLNSTTPAAKLLEKRRLMYDIHEAYETQLFEYNKQEEEFRVQESEIKQKDEQIQTELLKFCKELQMNETKKKKALSVLQSERQEKEKKMKEIAKLQIDLSADNQIFEHIEAKGIPSFKYRIAERLKKYEDYLNSIIKAYPDKYSDLDSITDRYKRLTISHSLLQGEHEKMEKDCEKMKFTLTQYEKEKNHEVLQLNNDIKEYQKMIEEKMIERNQLIADSEEQENRITEENLNLGRIFMAVENIHQRCCDGQQKIKQIYEDQNKDKEKIAKQQNREEKKQLKQYDEENYEVKCNNIVNVQAKQLHRNQNRLYSTYVIFGKLQNLAGMKLKVSKNEKQLINMLKYKPFLNFSVQSQKKSKRWYLEHINDFYVKESKRLSLRSRAAFKLMQINEKYHIYTEKQNVLDLGAAPGSWSQIIAEKCKVTAVDLLLMQPIINVKLINGDIMDKRIINLLKQDQFDVVLSDMAPNLSGDHELDHQEITQLNQIVLLLSNFTLKLNGNLVMKTFIGSDEKKSFDFYRIFFSEFYREKPLSSRQESSELFYIGKGFNRDLLGNIIMNPKKIMSYETHTQDRIRKLIIDYKMIE